MEDGPRPADLLTPAALRNAMVVMQAIGGSTHGIIHPSAITGRTGHPLPLPLEMLDEIGRKVPVLVDLKHRASTTSSISTMPAERPG